MWGGAVVVTKAVDGLRVQMTIWFSAPSTPWQNSPGRCRPGVFWLLLFPLFSPIEIQGLPHCTSHFKSLCISLTSTLYSIQIHSSLWESQINTVSPRSLQSTHRKHSVSKRLCGYKKLCLFRVIATEKCWCLVATFQRLLGFHYCHHRKRSWICLFISVCTAGPWEGGFQG